MRKQVNSTYVGDEFTVRYPRIEKEAIPPYNGMRCKLMGFKARLEYALPHVPRLQHLEPGIYQTIGDPLVKLETGKLLDIPLMYLEPEGYTFEDEIDKNYRYYKEQMTFHRVGELPTIKCNVGDTILIAKDGVLEDDVVATVDDVSVQGSRVIVAFEHEDQLLTVPQTQIIDVLELGPYSEEFRYRRQMKTVKEMARLTNPGMKYADHEQLDEGCEQE